MDIHLNDIEARILGSLMEKSLSTPDHYPLSLNALVNACNQKSSRDPVVSYDQHMVQAALDDLCNKDIVFQSNVSRVPKYEESFSQARQLVPRETALLCLLLLRGPQTTGELRSRSTRMYAFESLDEVMETLGNLEAWGLAKRLDRLPGHKESRYGQLVSDASVEAESPAAPPAADCGPEPAVRLEKMEQAVESLQQELDALKQAFDDFKKQFE